MTSQEGEFAESQILILQNQNQNLERLNQEMQSVMEKFQKDIERIKQELQRAEGKIQMLEESNQKLESLHQKSKLQIEELEKQNNQAQIALESKKQEFAKIKKDQKEQENYLIHVLSERDEFQNLNQQKQQEIANLKDQNTRVENEIEQLKQQHSKMCSNYDTKIENLMKQISQLEIEVNQSKEKRQQQDNLFQQLQNEYQKSQNELHQLKNLNQAQQSELLSLKQKDEKSQNEIQQLQNEIQKQQNEIYLLRQIKTEVENQREQMTKEREEQRQYLSKFQVYPRKALSKFLQENQLDKDTKAYFQELSQTHNSYRSIKNDGNCFFRSIGFAYLEYLSRFSTPIQYLQEFINKIQSNKGYYQIRPNQQSSSHEVLSKVFIQFLEKLEEQKQRQLKTRENNQIFQFLIEELQHNKDNQDEALVWQMRCLTANYHEQKASKSRSKQNLNEDIKNILTMGQEAEIAATKPLQDIFNLKILLLKNSSTQQVKENLEKVKGTGKQPLVFVQSETSQYYIVYSKEQTKQDGYDETNETFQQNASQIQSEAQDSEQSYKKTKQDLANENVDFKIMFHYHYISTEKTLKNRVKSVSTVNEQEVNQIQKGESFVKAQNYS